MLDRLLEYASKASQVMVWIGGAALMLAAVMTTVDVILRKAISWTLGGADEIAGYVFACATSFAFAFAMLQRTHVRIDALYMHLPRPVRLFLDFAGFILLGSFLTLIARQAFQVWSDSYANSSVSITPMVTPLALPQGIWVFGMMFFMLVFILLLCRLIQAILQRDWTRMTVLIGARSLEEEIRLETEHAHAAIEREHQLMHRGPPD